MNGNRAIRVVKKEERNRKENVSPKTNSARETARDMVHTVTNWVNEVQQKRRTETRSAIKALFSETPRPSEI